MMKGKSLLLLSCIILSARLLSASPTGSRLISYMILRHDGTSYVDYDSARFMYSGPRGGDLTHMPLKCDSSREYNYNTTTSLWEDKNKSFQKFDAGSNVVYDSVMVYNTITTFWVNSSLDVYTYDAAHNLLSDITQQWNIPSSVWTNNQKTVNTYDANNNQIGQVVQTWSGTAWVNFMKKVRTFNAANKVTQQLAQQWNTTTSTWDNNLRHIYTYDANNNNLTDTTDYWNTSTSTWVNSNLSIYTYGTSNEMLTQLNQTWNASTSTWTNYTKYLFSSFDANNVTLPQMEIDQIWNTATSTFDNNKRFQNTYNTGGQLLTMLGDTWVATAWQGSLNDESRRYHYEDYVTAVKSLIAKGGEANIYPVPANNLLNIDLNWNEPQAFVISIIDLQGRVTRTWQVPTTAKYHNAIDVSQMPYGTYIIKIDGTKGQVIKQIIVSPR